MDSGQLNMEGINPLRNSVTVNSITYNDVVWGNRTLIFDSPFRYISVRRLTNYIENSIWESTGWVKFEPNNEITWSLIRFRVGNFMKDLSLQGAFYKVMVDCDATTTTPADIEQGFTNCDVLFDPVTEGDYIVLQFSFVSGS